LIVYTCPKCGSDLISIVLASYPPVEVTTCSKCGWRHSTPEQIFRMPFCIDDAELTKEEDR